ncbi:morphogenic membrane protein MmpA [Streptomyces sp. MBT84]|uniref:morphogenic membrane protein MmpA n=1 Tax=Streptomyces sp. MBT84 TaxID=1488414 RepID=UPI0035AC243C
MPGGAQGGGRPARRPVARVRELSIRTDAAGSPRPGGWAHDDTSRPESTNEPAAPVERGVRVALLLAAFTGLAWTGGMIYTVLTWPL